MNIRSSSLPPPPRRSKWLAFWCVAVGVFMSTLDGSIVNIALPVIMREVKAPLPTVEWVMMAYLLIVSALLMGFGRLGDLKGRKWVYLRGLWVFTAGSLCCGLSSDVFGLIASRSFQGIGAAMIMSCTQAIVVDAFPMEERGRALGMMGAVVASGLTSGPAIGGWLLTHFSWHSIFYINIPVGLVLGAVSARVLAPDPPLGHDAGDFDAKGALLLAMAMSAFLMAVTHLAQWGLTHPATLGLGVAFVAAMAGLILDEIRNPHPIVSLELLRRRLFVLPVLSAMILFMGLFALIFLMPFFLLNPRGLSEMAAGHFMVTPFLFLFVFAPVAGFLYDRVGSRGLCTTGMALLATSFYLMSGLRADAPSWSLIWRLALAGIGIAIFTAPNNAAVMGAVPRRYMGVASGTVATVRNLGMVLGIAITGAIFNLVYTSLTGEVFTRYRPERLDVFMTAFRMSMLAACGMACVGVLLSLSRGTEAPRSGSATP